MSDSLTKEELLSIKLVKSELENIGLRIKIMENEKNTMFKAYSLLKLSLYSKYHLSENDEILDDGEIIRKEPEKKDQSNGPA